MAKALRLADFRARRVVLEPKDFALGPDHDPPPSDLIDKETWQGITELPDDVSIRTTNYRGSLIRTMCHVQDAWMQSVGIEEIPIYDVMTLVYLELQATTFNTLCGYYRTAISGLRNAVELTAIGAYYQLSGKLNEYAEWSSGEPEHHSEFRDAWKFLLETEPLKHLEARFCTDLSDNLFHIEKGKKPCGWVPRLHSRLSEYTHSRPKYSNPELWGGNGPVYSDEALTFCFDKFLEALALDFLLVRVCILDFCLPKRVLRAFRSHAFTEMSAVHLAYEQVFNCSVGAVKRRAHTDAPSEGGSD